jgi:hypothetical protein
MFRRIPRDSPMFFLEFQEDSSVDVQTKQRLYKLSAFFFKPHPFTRCGGNRTGVSKRAEPASNPAPAFFQNDFSAARHWTLTQKKHERTMDLPVN